MLRTNVSSAQLPVNTCNVKLLKQKQTFNVVKQTNSLKVILYLRSSVPVCHVENDVFIQLYYVHLQGLLEKQSPSHKVLFLLDRGKFLSQSLPLYLYPPP